MRRRLSRSRDLGGAAALFVAIAAAGWPAHAWAQACCAGASAVTPGRLEMHEDAIAGLQLKAGAVIGSYDTGGHYVASPPGDLEEDFEQDLFAAWRLTRRAQVAWLVPIVETMRSTPQDGTHGGGGLGDVNASVRYDLTLAGDSGWIPGLAILAGVTFPTGRAPEQASPPLFVDSTGIGALQGNIALAAEQTFGSWLIGATGLVAMRTPRFGQQLAPQVTLLATAAYSFDAVVVALSASYTFEGDATASGGTTVPDSGKRVTAVTLSGLVPLSDRWRLLGGLFLNPPLDAVGGSNQPTATGLTLTCIRSWY
jgi:hypothetical protein